MMKKENMEKELLFFAVGDAGENNPIKRDISKIIRKHSPNKIILLGDNFYKYGIDSEYDERWKTHYEDIFPNTTMYSTLGNHCYLGNIDAQINYSKLNKNWILPNRYYDKKIYLDEKDYIHLISLDTFEIARKESTNCSLNMGIDHNKMKNYLSNFNSKEQLEWLDNTLKNSTAKWKIVFGHYPIFSNGTHGDCPEMIDQVLPILLKNNVHLYLSGHDHNICYSQYDNLHVIVSGNGSYITNIKKDPFFKELSSSHGICYLKIKTSQLEFGFYDLDGKKLFSKCI